MTNTKETAAKWTAFIADRPEFPAGERLLEALRAGEITRLCDCGCNAVNAGQEPRLFAGEVSDLSFGLSGHW